MVIEKCGHLEKVNLIYVKLEEVLGKPKNLRNFQTNKKGKKYRTGFSRQVKVSVVSLAVKLNII